MRAVDAENKASAGKYRSWALERSEACILGERAYWERVYAAERREWEESDVVGDDWFAEHTATRLGAWLVAMCGEGRERVRLLDVGCGNGSFLMQLAREHGFRHLFGVDYSESAVALARSMWAKRMSSANGELAQAVFTVGDVRGYVPPTADGRVDVLHDKGTLDAVALQDGGAWVDAYLQRCLWVWLGAQPGSKLVITSCNFTAEELRAQVERAARASPSDTLGVECGRILELRELSDPPQYPVLEYAGQRGSPVVTLGWRWECREKPAAG
ncbi:hypothetical protein CDCA_CDCA03G0872 [Cyanidium caldarium]|uniref:Protein-lysine N-methyltransferase CDCA_CDCA03G0872 n=1 Tax=Cyanidium caldarium TaxID=2771 RepID=A0AAV9IRI2_CYACA|nr:hypothetical protein CDCA_CDCA03G0872 [Cyanidium caldarium]